MGCSARNATIESTWVALQPWPTEQKRGPRISCQHLLQRQSRQVVSVLIGIGSLKPPRDSIQFCLGRVKADSGAKPSYCLVVDAVRDLGSGRNRYASHTDRFWKVG
jgi:hypothetical protein